MEKATTSESNLSTDSLEDNCLRKVLQKHDAAEESADTILVPFYENDVLMKVPKNKQKQENKQGRGCSNIKKEPLATYLVHKEKPKRTSYLEMFRKQFSAVDSEKKCDDNEISSLAPEYGDTERESIGDDVNGQPPEFFESESYNDIYYDKILNDEIVRYLDYSFNEDMRLNEEVGCQIDDADQNLKSISEVSRPRRSTTRHAEPIPNVKLGGLGPDMEKIKPRLERARSLQRYSEKVRMENRLKIYQKIMLAEHEKKAEKELLSVKRNSASDFGKHQHDAHHTSYLLSNPPNQNKRPPKTHQNKAKSADIVRTREKIGVVEERSNRDQKEPKKKDSNDQKPKSAHQAAQVKNPAPKAKSKERAKGEVQQPVKVSTKEKVKISSKSKGINTVVPYASEAPVQISFLVNVGGVQSSRTLKSMEEKHRMYQEQVKSFSINKDD